MQTCMLLQVTTQVQQHTMAVFAHVHATGKGYFAHGGQWIELMDENSTINIQKLKLLMMFLL